MNPLLIGPLIDIIKNVLGKVLPDPQAQAAAQAQALELIANGTFDQRNAQALALAQIDVNKSDAAGQSAMQRNGRPFILWVCGVAMAWDTIARPMISYAGAYAGHPIPDLPNLSSDQLYGVLFGILGLGSLRTVEKVKGAA